MEKLLIMVEILHCIYFLYLYLFSKKVDVDNDSISICGMFWYRANCFESKKIFKKLSEIEINNIFEDENDFIIFLPTRSKSVKTNYNVKLGYKFYLDESIINFINTTEANKVNQEEENNIIKKIGKTIPYKIIIPSKNIEDTNEKEYYLNGIFLAGLSETCDVFIKNSNKYSSLCNHSDCSSVPSLEPDILFSYPKEKLITSEIAKLFFPTGIKLCYSYNSKVSEMNKFKNMKYSKMNIVTNTKGEQKYIIGYYFYVKYPKSVYNTKFKVNPLENNTKQKEQNKTSTLNPISFIKSNLHLGKKKLKRTYNLILVPYVIGIISNCPGIMALDQIMFSLYHSILTSKKNNNEFADIINFLLNEVTLPPMNQSITLYLPNYEGTIILKSSIYKDNINSNYPVKSLFDLISLDNILSLFFLLLLENKVVIVGDNSQNIFMVCDSLIQLLFPLKWMNTYIPLATEDMIQYLQSFIPFLIGMNEEIFENAKKVVIDSNMNEIYVFKLKAQTLYQYEQKKKNKINHLFLQKKFGNFPVHSFLMLELNKIFNEHKDDISFDYDLVIKEIFLNSMLKLFGNYKLFTSSINRTSLFSSDIFLKNQDENYQKFYQNFIQTQNFLIFLQNSKNLEYAHFNKLCEEYNQQYQKAPFSSKQDNIISNNSNNRHLNNTIQEEVSKELSFSSSSNSERTSDEIIDESFPEIEYHLIPFFLINSDYSWGAETTIEELTKEINKYYLSKDINNLKSEASFNQFTKSNPIAVFTIEEYDNIFSVISKTDYTITNLSYDLLPSKFLNKKIEGENNNEEVNSPNIIRARYRKRQSLIASIFRARRQSDVDIYKEQLLDILKDFLSNILQGLEQKDITINDITCLFLFKELRKEFINTIYQEKFKENISHELTKKSFEDLTVIVRISFQSGNNLDEYSDMILLTKTLFCYYYINNKRSYYLFEEFKNKKDKIQYWKAVVFWNFFYNEEIRVNLSNKDKIKSEIKHIMIELNMEKVLINEFIKSK